MGDVTRRVAYIEYAEGVINANEFAKVFACLPEDAVLERAVIADFHRLGTSGFLVSSSEFMEVPEMLQIPHLEIIGTRDGDVTTFEWGYRDGDIDRCTGS